MDLRLQTLLYFDVFQYLLPLQQHSSEMLSYSTMGGLDLVQVRDVSWTRQYGPELYFLRSYLSGH